ncbi:MAG: hypothetical protein NXI11_00780 [Proteobacteria bacterium]|nr:hypothetical protein [Pseudomonadota bacterium]
MAGFWGKLFGTDEALKGVVDGVTNGIDALVYTEEERANAAAESRAEARAMVVEWMRSTQGQNLARRLLALVVTAVWLAMYLIAACLNITAVWVGDALSSRLTESAAIVGQRAHEMNGAMMLILGFYFAAPHMGELAAAAIGRFGGRGHALKERAG